MLKLQRATRGVIPPEVTRRGMASVVYVKLNDLSNIKTIDRIGQATCREISSLSGSTFEFGYVPYGFVITLDRLDEFMKRHNYQRVAVYMMELFSGEAPTAIYGKTANQGPLLSYDDLAELYVGTKFNTVSVIGIAISATLACERSTKQNRWEMDIFVGN